MTSGGLWLFLQGGTVLLDFGVVFVLFAVVVVDDTEDEVLWVVVDDTTVVEVVVLVVDVDEEVEGVSGTAPDSARETSSSSALTTVATPTPVLLKDSLLLVIGVLALLVSDLQTSSSGWIV